MDHHAPAEGELLAGFQPDNIVAQVRVERTLSERIQREQPVVADVPEGGEAAPEHVKLAGAIHADGSPAGAPEKTALMLGRRKFVIATTGELIARIQKGSDKAALIDALKRWSDTLPPATRPRRGSQEAVNQAAGRELIAGACAALEKGSPEGVLEALSASKSALEGAKP